MPKNREKKKRYLRGKRIEPEVIKPDMSVVDLVDKHFHAYNAARLREACHLFSQRMLGDDVTVGLSLSGALTPAGLGSSAIVPLIENGFVDWIVSTGANLYHDIHFGIGEALHRGSPFVDDRELWNERVVRIYDVVMDYNALLATDRFVETIFTLPEFQRRMGTAELHHLMGRYLLEREKALNLPGGTILSAAYRCQVPVYTSSPGDSSIGMSLAWLSAVGNGLELDVALDVNETSAIVLRANREGKSAVVILGGGSPKNFMLQTEPLLQVNTSERVEGHHYFLQITDARPDTGGLSGATPSEAVSWGKVDPDELSSAVVVYADTTLALPILTSYVLAKNRPRGHKRLYSLRREMVEDLVKVYRPTSMPR